MGVCQAVLMGLGRLNIKHLIMLRKAKLYRHLFLAHNSLSRDVFSVFLSQNSDDDPIYWRLFFDCISCCWLCLDIVSKLL